MSEITYTKRQQKIIDAATRAVEDANFAVAEAEKSLDFRKRILRDAEKELHRLNELGDML